jgi:hypothetical protein
MLGHGQAASSFPTPRLPQNTISMSKPCSQQTGHIEIFRLGSRPGALKIGLAAQSLTGKAAAAGPVGLVSLLHIYAEDVLAVYPARLTEFPRLPNSCPVPPARQES